MKKSTRHDTVNRTLPEGERYAASEDSAKTLFGRRDNDGAEAARQRMLERRGLAGGKSEPAAKARQRMLERQQR